MDGVELRPRACGGHIVVALHGQLGIGEAADTAATIAAIAGREPGREHCVIVDLQALEFIDCAALRALVSARQQARRAGGEVLLAAPAGAVPSSVTSGSDLTYTIKIANAGPSEAWRVTLTGHLPYATRFQKASATGGRCSGARAGARGATITCHLGTINSGGSRHVRIQVKITVTASQQVIASTAKVKSVTPDPLRSNNTATVHTKITK
jgi:anti-anti-sigma factor